MLSEQQRAARVLARHGTPVTREVSGLADQFSYDPKKPLSHGSSYDQYLYGRSLIRSADEKPDWQQTMTGRIATRIFTRGFFGALAFTWAGSYAGRSLRNYDPHSIRDFTEWRKALINPRAVSTEAYVNQPNTMQAVAKAFDVLAGTPIKAVAKVLGGKDGQLWADKATHFRPRAMYHDPISKIRSDAQWQYRTYGRSLGHEVVAITTDFAAASAADATARFLAQVIDPNVEKDDEAMMRKEGEHAQFDWYRNGAFSPAAFAKDTLKKAWQVVSFNQGEDWAVAVPYAYFMKWHRNVIDRVSPGFKYASDHAHWNGASIKALAHMRPGGVSHIQEVGDYNIEGAWDLQARFTVYNVLTLMYRETYKNIANGVSQWWKGPSWLPKLSFPANPVESAVEGAGDAVRYGVKSFIKANLYMQPAVPFFWLFRVPQSKWRASPILVNDKGVNGQQLPASASHVLASSQNLPDAVHAANLNHDFGLGTAGNAQLRDGYLQAVHASKRPGIDNIGFARTGDHSFTFAKAGQTGGTAYVGGIKADQPFMMGDPFDIKNSRTTFGAIVNPFGKLSNKAGNWVGSQLCSHGAGLQKVAAAALGATYTPAKGESVQQAALKQRQKIADGARIFTDASFAYTPYMIAKAETALRWDNKDMDAALYRLIDGAVSFNLKETRAAVKDIGNILTNPPPTVKDPAVPHNNDSNAKPDNRISTAAISRSIVHPAHRTVQ